MKKEFDVHFSLNGFYSKVEAKDNEEAKEIVEEWIQDIMDSKKLTTALRTGVGVEIGDILES